MPPSPIEREGARRKFAPSHIRRFNVRRLLPENIFLSTRPSLPQEGASGAVLKSRRGSAPAPGGTYLRSAGLAQGFVRFPQRRTYFKVSPVGQYDPSRSTPADGLGSASPVKSMKEQRPASTRQSRRTRGPGKPALFDEASGIGDPASPCPLVSLFRTCWRAAAMTRARICCRVSSSENR